MHKQGKKSKTKSTNNIDKALQAFLKTDCQSAKFGRYVIDGDRLVWRQAVVSEFFVREGAINVLIKSVEIGNIGLLNHTVDELKNLSTAFVKVRYLEENVIAKRIRQDDKVLYVGNSERLELIGRKVSFGRVRDNWDKTEIQGRLERLIPMLGFRFFDSDGADLLAQVKGWKQITEQVPGYQKQVGNES